MGIKKKLTLLAIVMALGLSMLGGLGICASRDLGRDMRDIVENTVPIIWSLGMIDMNHDNIHGIATQALLGISQHEQKHVLAAANSLDEAEKIVKEHFVNIFSKKISDQAKGHLEASQAGMATYIASAKTLMELAKKNDLKGAEASFEAVDKEFLNLEQTLDKMGGFIEDENKQIFEKDLHHAWIMQIAMAVAYLLTLIFCLGFLAYLSAGLKKSLEMVGGRLGRGSSEVTIAVTQLSAASSDLSSSATQQAAALQETSAAIEEISSMVRKAAELATTAETSTTTSKQNAEKGNQIVDRMTQSMEAINRNNDEVATQMTESNQKISTILKVIEEVGLKTKVINDIVFQTKLLSFNASVEAARAGEHGKGFAVVAEEVGNLAQMSGNAAREINSLLSESLTTVSNIVAETKSKVENIVTEAKTIVGEGTAVAKECGQVLRDIVTSSTEVSEMVASINQANTESARGVEEISKAVQQLDEATQVNASAASACALSSDQLSKQIVELREAAADLTVVVDGRANLSKFVWKDEYLLGVNAMDDEHKILIEKINFLSVALGEGPKKAKAAFTDLASYTAEHFGDEEKFFDSIQYPDSVAHKGIHRRVLTKVGEFGKQLDNGTLVPAELMNFLNDWLLKHILGVDMVYARFSRGERAGKINERDMMKQSEQPQQKAA